jgi:phage-related protein
MITLTMERKIKYYKNENGRCFIDEFISSLTPNVQEKVLWTLKLLRDIEILKRPYFSKLQNSDGIWEAIIDSGSNTFRVLFFFDAGFIVVLTHGFTKKTQKTPPEEIKKAEAYKKDYLSRK